MNGHTQLEDIEFQFFVGQEFLGVAKRPYIWRGAWVSPRNLHFFCPKCGVIWANIISLDSNISHYAVHQRCMPCDGSGSFWHPYDELQTGPALPRIALERELELLTGRLTHELSAP